MTSEVTLADSVIKSPFKVTKQLFDLGDVVVSVLAIGSKVRGFKIGRGR
jgi:hypothetical protein